MGKLLVATTLYPNQVQFRHGIFVEARLRRLLAVSDYRATVIAPVPWFPFTSQRFARYAEYARVPHVEQRHGIDIYHPRYLVVPKIGMLLTPLFLAWAMWRQLRAIERDGDRFDVIDAHYYYPDGVAAAILARVCRLPLLITARGTDINVIAKMRVPGALMRWAARTAHCSIAVSAALQQTMCDVGFPATRVRVLRNGVDLQHFQPPSTAASERDRPGKQIKLLSVGNLIELKGHDLVVEALTMLDECTLTIVGDGPLRDTLEQQARECGVADRVYFVGAVDQARLVELYGEADMLVLASSREGMPNVVLEAMACDTPVVATNVGGVPEIMLAPEAGVLLARRDAAAIAEGVRRLREHYPSIGATRKYAEQFSWDRTIDELRVLIDAVTVSAGEQS